MQFSKSAMVSFLLLAAACSSTTTVTTTDGGGGNDAGKDVAVKDTGTNPDATAGTCKPQDVSGFAPAAEPGPATAAGACTDQVALDYYNACIDPGDTTVCTALGKDATKAACLKCLSTPDTAAKWGALVEDSQALIRNNIAGCLAVKGDAACAKAISESSQCTRAACSGRLTHGRTGACARASTRGTRARASLLQAQNRARRRAFARAFGGARAARRARSRRAAAAGRQSELERGPSA